MSIIEKHFNELDAHEKKLLLIEQQRLEKLKQLATKYNPCLKMDYQSWTQVSNSKLGVLANRTRDQ